MDDPRKWEAGRETDKRIAEIMGYQDVGWKCLDFVTCECGRLHKEYVSSESGDPQAILVHKVGKGLEQIPLFSTTGDGLFLMLEWIRKETNIAEVRLCQRKKDNGSVVYFVDSTGYVIGYSTPVYRESTPLAVASAIGMWDKESKHDH